MPTYEYKCNDCAVAFERVQKISEAALTVCPTCGGTVKRLISGGAGLLFKGSGFYLTDYRSEGYKQQAAKEGASSGAASPAAAAASSTSSTPSAPASAPAAPAAAPSGGAKAPSSTPSTSVAAS